MPRELVLRLPPSSDPESAGAQDELTRAASRSLGVAADAIVAVRVRRISFDARPRHRDWRVALDVWLRGERVPPGPATSPPELGRPRPDAPHVAVVGSGPAGLFAALDLAAAGVRVTVLERGGDVQERRRPIARLHRGQGVDPDSNYCFGEGGAGTYSDGKLYTRSGSKSAIRGVLETLVAHGAPPAILASWRPHVGSNRLPAVVRAMRETLRRAGSAVRFHARVERLETRGGRVVALGVRDVVAGASERVEADAVVLATGHSAFDALVMARDAGARLVAKGFAMGVRAEHGQAWLDERQYGGLRAAHELPASFYELAHEADERGVYSFCMCPGGFIVPATTGADRVVVNGMSLARRDSPYANAGIVVAVEPEDWCGERGEREGWPALLEGLALPRSPDEDPLFGARVQLALERAAARAGGGGGRAPAERVDRFVERAPGKAGATLPTSLRPGVAPAALDDVLPRGLAERLRAGLALFDRRIPGFVSEHGQLVGVESRTSSPVRIARDRETCEADGVAGLWPCGEGAGYAGGIVSAALDGRRVARAILARADFAAARSGS